MADPEAVPAVEEATGPVPVAVQFLSAKPNQMFSEAMTQVVRFLRYTQAVPCAECGKRSRYHWTMLVSFQAQRLQPGMFTLAVSEQVHLPCAPVCRDHLLAPAALPAYERKKRHGRG